MQNQSSLYGGTLTATRPACWHCRAEGLRLSYPSSAPQDTPWTVFGVHLQGRNKDLGIFRAFHNHKQKPKCRSGCVSLRFIFCVKLLRGPAKRSLTRDWFTAMSCVQLHPQPAVRAAARNRTGVETHLAVPSGEGAHRASRTQQLVPPLPQRGGCRVPWDSAEPELRLALTADNCTEEVRLNERYSQPAFAAWKIAAGMLCQAASMLWPDPEVSGKRWRRCFMAGRWGVGERWKALLGDGVPALTS